MRRTLYNRVRASPTRIFCCRCRRSRGKSYWPGGPCKPLATRSQSQTPIHNPLAFEQGFHRQPPPPLLSRLSVLAPSFFSSLIRHSISAFEFRLLPRPLPPTKPPLFPCPARPTIAQGQPDLHQASGCCCRAGKWWCASTRHPVLQSARSLARSLPNPRSTPSISQGCLPFHHPFDHCSSSRLFSDRPPIQPARCTWPVAVLHKALNRFLPVPACRACAHSNAATTLPQHFNSSLDLPSHIIASPTYCFLSLLAERTRRRATAGPVVDLSCQTA